MKKIFILLLLIIVSTNTAASTDEPNIKVFGLGTTKCERFTKTIDENKAGRVNVYKLWISGYISSYSSFITLYGKEIKNIDTGIVINDLYPVCKNDGDEFFAHALSSIISKYINTDAPKTKYTDSKFVSELCSKVLPEQPANKRVKNDAQKASRVLP